jgi:hypothetical protein
MQPPGVTVKVESRPSMTCSAVRVEEELARAMQQDLPAVLERRLTITELGVDPPLVGAVVQVGVTLEGIALLVTELSALVTPSATSKLLRAVRDAPVTMAWSVGLGDSLKRLTSRV